ncbi:MAG: hypothetical protein AUH86_05035 [Acidobacteria bacterium 13_1_40CM_4_58_4]|nr:MAG: hypothetical protein AUH86_05035 [Acidobacteria bacterium 13_1_40CM_4_58_4]OLE58097.1 MAG: hypothetical protein AUG13_00700 [Chloroflexi bacterium 13_1_20CM_2_59_7]
MNDQAREQSKCSLAVEVLQSWGELRLRTKGVSMLPTLWPGDLVTVQSCSFAVVQPGEIVLYVREGRFLVSHRIVNKCSAESGAFLITRGDCTTKEDAPVPPGELLGKITEIRRKGALLASSQELLPFHRLFAYMLRRWSFFRRFVLYWYARRTDTDRDFKVAIGEPA